MHLSLLDIIVMCAYLAFLLGTAQLAAAKAGIRLGFHGAASLGRQSGTWWAAGISLLIADLSAEQILGLSGSAYAMGITVATYDWTAAIALIVVAKYLLPILRRNQIHTIPDFLCRRYGALVQMLTGSIWVLFLIFIKLTVILWLGAIAVHCITGLSYLISLMLIGLFAGNYALYVGLKQDAFGNLIQIILTLLAGIIVIWVTLGQVAEGGSHLDGLHRLMTELPDHFHMVLHADNPNYYYAPGLGMILGGMWVLHFAYWGVNQSIFRRTLECDTVQKAQHGLLITALIKLAFPFLVVLPGIIALYLVPGLKRPDAAIPELMTRLPSGILGFVFCALIIATVFSMGSQLSHIAEILTHDVLNNPILRLPERKRQIISHVVTFSALFLAICLARPLMGNVRLAFMYIQDMTGFLAPSILTLFLVGLVWKGANRNGALACLFGGLALSVACKLFWPGLPFIDRIGLIFLICILLMICGSRWRAHSAPGTPFTVRDIRFDTSRIFNLTSIGIILFLTGTYALLW